MIPNTSRKPHVLENSGLVCTVVARPLFLRLGHFFWLFLCDTTLRKIDAVVWTTWNWDRMCARYSYLNLKKKINFFFKNVFQFFFQKKLFFKKIFSPNFVFSQSFFWKFFFRNFFSNFSILGRFRSWGPVPLGDVTALQLLVEGYRNQNKFYHILN